MKKDILIREGFMPEIIFRIPKPQKWQPKPLGSPELAAIAGSNEREKLLEKYTSLHWAASDFLNILELLGEEKKSADVFNEQRQTGSVYFAAKVLSNLCGFAGLSCPTDSSILEHAQRYAELIPNLKPPIICNNLGQRSLFECK